MFMARLTQIISPKKDGSQPLNPKSLSEFQKNPPKEPFRASPKVVPLSLVKSSLPTPEKETRIQLSSTIAMIMGLKELATPKRKGSDDTNSLTDNTTPSSPKSSPLSGHLIERQSSDRTDSSGSTTPSSAKVSPAPSTKASVSHAVDPIYDIYLSQKNLDDVLGSIAYVEQQIPAENITDKDTQAAQEIKNILMRMKKITDAFVLLLDTPEPTILRKEEKQLSKAKKIADYYTKMKEHMLLPTIAGDKSFYSALCYTRYMNTLSHVHWDKKTEQILEKILLNMDSERRALNQKRLFLETLLLEAEKPAHHIPTKELIAKGKEMQRKLALQDALREQASEQAREQASEQAREQAIDKELEDNLKDYITSLPLAAKIPQKPLVEKEEDEYTDESSNADDASSVASNEHSADESFYDDNSAKTDDDSNTDEEYADDNSMSSTNEKYTANVNIDNDNESESTEISNEKTHSDDASVISGCDDDELLSIKSGSQQNSSSNNDSSTLFSGRNKRRDDIYLCKENLALTGRSSSSPKTF